MASASSPQKRVKMQVLVPQCRLGALALSKLLR